MSRRLALVGILAVVVTVAGIVTFRIVGGGSGALGSEMPAEILAFDIHTGHVMWSAHPDAVFVGPGSVASGKLSVYTEKFGNGCDQHAATITFDPVTGRQLSQQEERPYGNSNGPSVREGSIEFTALPPPDTDDPSIPGTLEATDLATGKKLWVFKLPSGRSFMSHLTVSGGVIVGLVRKNQLTEEEETSGSGFLAAIDAATGRQLWETQQMSGLNSGFVFADGQLYVPRSRSIVAFDARTGDRRWDVEVRFEGITNTPEGTVLSLAAADGLVVAAGRGKLEAYDLAGKERWTGSLPSDRNYSLLGMGGGRIYAGADGRSAKLACLSD